MRRTVLLPGTVVFYWTVLSKARAPRGVRRRAMFYRCRCACGRTKILDGAALKRGQTKSCGCARGIANRATKTTHGCYYHPLYNTYHGMMRRCHSPKDGNYHGWGARGIVVCPEWKGKPEVFIRWAETNGWARGLTLERRDNDGPYSPANCLFADQKTQSNNRRTNVTFMVGGRRMTLQQVADLHNVRYARLHYLVAARVSHWRQQSRGHNEHGPPDPRGRSQNCHGLP